MLFSLGADRGTSPKPLDVLTCVKRSGPPKPLIAAIACVILGIVAAGCSSNGSSSAADQAGAGRRVTDAGLSFTIPTGWRRVPLAGLPGADVPLELASFETRGTVRTICDPHRIVRQIPTGGALVQILEASRAALNRERDRLDE